MPNFLSYDIAHDIVHFDYGGLSANCPLCNGTASKDKAEKLAGECITKKRMRMSAYDGPMCYSEENGKKVKKGTIKLFVDVMKFSEDGAKLPNEIQLVPIGSWNTAKYGKVSVTKEDIVEMKENFDKGVRKGVMLDIDHGSTQHGDAAAGWIHEVEVRDTGLWATKIEYTKLGQELLGEKIYKFMSPEFSQYYENPENTSEVYHNVLIAGSLVNRPMFQKLKPLMASENADDLTKDKNNIMLFFEGNSDTNLNKKPMPNLNEIVLKNKEALSTEEVDFIKANESQLTDEQKVKFGLAEAKTEVIEAGEGSVTIKASELADLKARADQGVEARKMLERNQIEKQVDSLVFNDKGIKMKVEDRNKTVDFMETLSKDQRKTFSEILEALPTKEIFTVEGSEEQGSGDVSNLIDARAKELMKADENLSYKDALVKASEEPQFKSYVSKEE